MSGLHKGGPEAEHGDLTPPHKILAGESREELLRDPLYGGELTLVGVRYVSGCSLTIFCRLYERKSLLVQRELDLMGLGRYQKCIWLLCGFGYFLDLM